MRKFRKSPRDRKKEKAETTKVVGYSRGKLPGGKRNSKKSRVGGINCP